MMIDPLSRLLPTPMIFPPMMLVGLSEKDSDVGVDIAPLSPGPAPVFWAAPGAPGVVPIGAKPVVDCPVCPACAGLAPCCGCWPNPPKPAPAAGGPCGPPAPENCSVCGGFRLPISWPDG